MRHKWSYCFFCFDSSAELFSRRFQVGDQVRALVLLLQTGEDHLGSWDVFFRVGQVDFKRVGVPFHAFLDVGFRVGVSGGLAGLSSPESPQVGSSFVFASALDGVTLSATLHEKLLALVYVSGSHSYGFFVEFCWPVKSGYISSLSSRKFLQSTFKHDEMVKDEFKQIETTQL